MTEVLAGVKGMFANGGIVEKIAKGVFEGKGIDLENLDVLALAYVENLCETKQEL